MSLISNPYGIIAASDQSGIPRRLRVPSGIASGYGLNIFLNNAVRINPATGLLEAVTNPNGVPQAIWGIFAGCEFTPLGGRPTESPFWAAGTIVDPNYDFFAYVYPAWMPGTRWYMQADGSVAQAKLGSQFNITNVGAGNTTTGLGASTVGAGGIAANAQGQFALVEFAQGNQQTIQSAPGDAFTDLICTIALPQIGLGSQTSIG